MPLAPGGIHTLLIGLMITACSLTALGADGTSPPAGRSPDVAASPPREGVVQQGLRSLYDMPKASSGGTPAAKAGMQRLDIVTDFNGQPVASAQDLIQRSQPLRWEAPLRSLSYASATASLKSTPLTSCWANDRHHHKSSATRSPRRLAKSRIQKETVCAWASRSRN